MKPWLECDLILVLTAVCSGFGTWWSCPCPSGRFDSDRDFRHPMHPYMKDEGLFTADQMSSARITSNMTVFKVYFTA